MRGTAAVSTVAILNPRSGRGGAARAWAAVQSYLPGPVEVEETRAPGHAITLTRRALERSATTIVAVGGDGTLNEVVNGFFDGDALVSPAAGLAVVPHGTGSDFRRSVGLPADARALAAVIAAGATRPVDVMRVRYTTPDGSRASRHAINVTSFGLGGAVASRAGRSSRRLGGAVTFLIATLQTAARFSPCSVTLALDRAPAVAATITQVAIGNGQFHGGGMWACPGARVDDGWLDVTVVRELRLWQLVAALPRLYDGSIRAHPRVWSARVQRLAADADAPVPVEIDGEPLGRLPIEIDVVPRALRLLIPSPRGGRGWGRV